MPFLYSRKLYSTPIVSLHCHRPPLPVGVLKGQFLSQLDFQLDFLTSALKRLDFQLDFSSKIGSQLDFQLDFSAKILNRLDFRLDF